MKYFGTSFFRKIRVQKWAICFWQVDDAYTDTNMFGILTKPIELIFFSQSERLHRDTIAGTLRQLFQPEDIFRPANEVSAEVIRAHLKQKFDAAYDSINICSNTCDIGV